MGSSIAVQHNGLHTPEPTLEVDNSRVKAEKKRQNKARAAKAAKSLAAKEAHSQAKPQSPLDNNNKDALAQAKTLKEILSCKEDNYHKILGIREDYKDAIEENREIETTMYNRGI